MPLPKNIPTIHLSDPRTRVGAYCIRPYKHPVRDEHLHHKSQNDYPFSLGMIGGRMQYAPTRAHMYAQSPIVPENGAHLCIKFLIVSDNNKYLFQELNIVSIDDRYIEQSFIIASINNK